MNENQMTSRSDKGSKQGPSANKISGVDRPEFAISYLDKRLPHIRSIRTSLQACERRCRAFLNAVEELNKEWEEYGCTPYIEGMLTHSIEELCSFEESAMRTCNSLYYNLSTPVSIFGTRSLEAAEEEDYKRFGRDISGIQTAVRNDKILVKLPMLARQIPYSTMSAGAQAYTRTFSAVYAEDVARSVRFTLDTLGADVLKYTEKTLSFFYVYDKKQGQFLDSDAHDTKAIIDAIAVQLPGGDAPLFCDFSFATEQRNDLPEGTYICVSPGRYSFQNASILDEFKRSFLS